MLKKLIENELARILGCSNTALSQAMRYAMDGGKRIRPRLLIAIVEMFGAETKMALSPACAIEMVHAYSLIHDDLPCMDDDDLRRNRPTLHRAFSEGLAILAGDALLTDAFRVIAESKLLSSRQKIDLVAVLSKRIGSMGMAEGQARDILTKNERLSLSKLIQIDQKKTGDLFSACLEMGAIVANQPLKMQKQLRKIALSLGLAYQLADDLSDWETNHESAPMITLYGHKKIKNLLQKTKNKLISDLQPLPNNGKNILDVFPFSQSFMGFDMNS